MDLRVRVLGGFEIEGIDAHRLGSRKARTLLKVLALARRHPVSIDRLIEAVWTQATPARPEDQVLVLVSRLRAVLGGERLLRTDAGYSLRADWLDLDAMADLAAEAGHRLTAGSYRSARARAQAALALARGPVLPEEPEAIWVEAERAAAERLLASVRHVAARAALGAADYTAAAAFAAGALNADPYDEVALRLLMRADSQAGHPAAALAAYAQVKKRLDDDLGVDPAPETTSHYLAILRQEPLPADPSTPPFPRLLHPIAASTRLGRGHTPAQAPSEASSIMTIPLPAMVGRQRDMATTRALLARDDVRLVTLTGPGGVGKTQLALHAAIDAQSLFSDAVFIIPLAALRDARAVLPTIAQALGVDTGDRDLSKALGKRLQRGALVVLDNFEQLLDATGDVTSLLNAAPHLKILVTSRAPLRLYGEHLVPVAPLALPDVRDAPQAAFVAQFDSVRLFAARAQAARPDFALTDDNARTVADICRRLDGLPLAIELAASRLRMLSVGALLKRLASPLPVLTDGPGNMPLRQQTLRDTMAWSYDLLPLEEQALFRRLAVFRGCTLEAIESVIAEPPPLTMGTGASPARTDVLKHVTTLVDSSLLTPMEALDEDTRYVLLETVRDFAREQLEAAGETNALRQRHAAYYTALAESAAPALRASEQLLWLSRLSHERDNFRTALEWLTTGEPDRALGLRLGSALERYWILTGQVEEGRLWLDRALEHAAGIEGQTSLHAAALRAAGHLAHLRNDFASAQRLHEQSLAIACTLQDRHAAGRATSLLAFAALHRGQLEEAARISSEALTLCRESGDIWWTAHALWVAGGALTRSGSPARAAILYQESLSRFRHCGDRWGIAWALHGVGQVALHQGQLALAGTCYEERLSLCRTLGLRSAEAHALDVLATLARMQGNLDRAEILYEQSLGLRREWCGWDRASEAYLLSGLAETAVGRGDPAAGYARVLDGLAVLRAAPEVEDQPSRAALAALLTAGARLCALQHQYEHALRLAGTASWQREAAGAPLPGPDHAQLNRVLAPARSALGPQAERNAHAIHLTGAQALAVATEVVGGLAVRSSETQANKDRPEESLLTRRERDVAGLVARGYTNKRIAQTLVITEGTVATHVVHILDKLGFVSRAQVAVWATQHGVHLRATA
jgi:predicted ATPase/DNA-binding SARP family transcriptional activator/DNA-binding CsgD family transcriptional regulator